MENEAGLYNEAYEARMSQNKRKFGEHAERPAETSEQVYADLSSIFVNFLYIALLVFCLWLTHEISLDRFERTYQDRNARQDGYIQANGLYTRVDCFRELLVETVLAPFQFVLRILRSVYDTVIAPPLGFLFSLFPNMASFIQASYEHMYHQWVGCRLYIFLLNMLHYINTMQFWVRSAVIIYVVWFICQQYKIYTRDSSRILAPKRPVDGSSSHFVRNEGFSPEQVMVSKSYSKENIGSSRLPTTHLYEDGTSVWKVWADTHCKEVAPGRTYCYALPTAEIVGEATAEPIYDSKKNGKLTPTIMARAEAVSSSPSSNLDFEDTSNTTTSMFSEETLFKEVDDTEASGSETSQIPPNSDLDHEEAKLAQESYDRITVDEATSFVTSEQATADSSSAETSIQAAASSGTYRLEAESKHIPPPEHAETSSPIGDFVARIFGVHYASKRKAPKSSSSVVEKMTSTNPAEPAEAPGYVPSRNFTSEDAISVKSTIPASKGGLFGKDATSSFIRVTSTESSEPAEAADDVRPDATTSDIHLPVEFTSTAKQDEELEGDTTSSISLKTESGRWSGAKIDTLDFTAKSYVDWNTLTTSVGGPTPIFSRLASYIPNFSYSVGEGKLSTSSSTSTSSAEGSPSSEEEEKGKVSTSSSRTALLDEYGFNQPSTTTEKVGSPQRDASATDDSSPFQQKLKIPAPAARQYAVNETYQHSALGESVENRGKGTRSQKDASATDDYASYQDRPNLLVPAARPSIVDETYQSTTLGGSIETQEKGARSQKDASTTDDHGSRRERQRLPIAAARPGIVDETNHEESIKKPATVEWKQAEVAKESRRPLPKGQSAGTTVEEKMRAGLLPAKEKAKASIPIETSATVPDDVMTRKEKDKRTIGAGWLRWTEHLFPPSGKTQSQQSVHAPETAASPSDEDTKITSDDYQAVYGDLGDYALKTCEQEFGKPLTTESVETASESSSHSTAPATPSSYSSYSSASRESGPDPRSTRDQEVEHSAPIPEYGKANPYDGRFFAKTITKSLKCFFDSGKEDCKPKRKNDTAKNDGDDQPTLVKVLDVNHADLFHWPKQEPRTTNEENRRRVGNVIGTDFDVDFAIVDPRLDFKIGAIREFWHDERIRSSMLSAIGTTTATTTTSSAILEVGIDDSTSTVLTTPTMTTTSTSTSTSRKTLSATPISNQDIRTSVEKTSSALFSTFLIRVKSSFFPSIETISSPSSYSQESSPSSLIETELFSSSPSHRSEPSSSIPPVFEQEEEEEQPWQPDTTTAPAPIEDPITEDTSTSSNEGNNKYFNTLEAQLDKDHIAQFEFEATRPEAQQALKERFFGKEHNGDEDVAFELDVEGYRVAAVDDGEEGAPCCSIHPFTSALRAGAAAPVSATEAGAGAAKETGMEADASSYPHAQDATFEHREYREDTSHASGPGSPGTGHGHSHGHSQGLGHGQGRGEIRYCSLCKQMHCCEWE